MKTFLLILTVSILLFSCSCHDKANKLYVIEIIYYDGQVDTLRLAGSGQNKFALLRGDLQHLRGVEGNHDVIVSGVREFNVLYFKEVDSDEELINTKKLN